VEVERRWVQGAVVVMTWGTEVRVVEMAVGKVVVVRGLGVGVREVELVVVWREAARVVVGLQEAERGWVVGQSVEG
jgi:hypothetical protein